MCGAGDCSDTYSLRLWFPARFVHAVEKARRETGHGGEPGNSFALKIVCGSEFRVAGSGVGRVTPCAPPSRLPKLGAHGVTRPTLQRSARNWIKQPAWKNALKSCADPIRARHFLSQLASSKEASILQRCSTEQTRVLCALLSGPQAMAEPLIAHPDWLTA